MTTVASIAGWQWLDAIGQRRVAEEARRIALARLLAVQASDELDQQVDPALLLGAQGYRLHQSSETRGALMNVLSASVSDKLITICHGPTGFVRSVAFSADGSTLASRSADQTIRLWGIDVRDPQYVACRRANRNLTEAEWQHHLGAEPDEKTCPDVPVPDG